MKIVRHQITSSPPTRKELKKPWKIMVVDDEPGVHALTSLNLSDLIFQGRRIQLLGAYTASEARQLLAQHPDVAVALVDVVMETADAGLTLVDYIRNTVGNKNIRLIIRTGQPGRAPERYVIDRYDIDDYKEKTELTSQKLYTVVRSALKSYQDLCSIECTNRGLTQLLHGAPELYRIRSLQDFFQGVLDQVLALLKVGTNHPDRESGYHPSILIATQERQNTGNWVFRCGSGPFRESSPLTIAEIARCQLLCQGGEGGPVGSSLLPLAMMGQVVGFIFLENGANLTEQDRQFLRLLSNQCVSALENHWLYDDLEQANHDLTHVNVQLAEANQQTTFMLAVASEFKDQETGNHINRIVSYTEQLALQLAVTFEEAKSYARASMLHDLGKMGIPDAILQKPGKLTKNEFDLIKNHPRMGMEILSKSDWFALAREIAYSHHEKWDGSGYPQGLKGEEIPLPARIVAVADVFDALTSKRPYKDAWSLEAAVHEIKINGGSHFDPNIVDAFIKLYDNGTLHKILRVYS